jgi:hypothetical protein
MRTFLKISPYLTRKKDPFLGKVALQKREGGERRVKGSWLEATRRKCWEGKISRLFDKAESRKSGREEGSVYWDASSGAGNAAK